MIWFVSFLCNFFYSLFFQVLQNIKMIYFFSVEVVVSFYLHSKMRVL